MVGGAAMSVVGGVVKVAVAAGTFLLTSGVLEVQLKVRVGRNEVSLSTKPTIRLARADDAQAS